MSTADIVQVEVEYKKETKAIVTLTEQGARLLESIMSYVEDIDLEDEAGKEFASYFTRGGAVKAQALAHNIFRKL